MKWFRSLVASVLVFVVIVGLASAARFEDLSVGKIKVENQATFVSTDGKKTVTIGTNGNVTIEGDITAAAYSTNGTFNGNAFCIVSTDGKVTNYIGTNGNISCGVGTNKFNVSSAGVVYIAGTLTAAGAARLPVTSYVLDETTTRTFTSADYGKMVAFTNGAAITATLPANGAAAGTWIDVCIASQAENDSVAITISAATADTLVGPNDLDLKSVTWGAGHRKNAYARFWSDGTLWHVLNLGGTTMTYND